MKREVDQHAHEDAKKAKFLPVGRATETRTSPKYIYPKDLDYKEL